MRKKPKYKHLFKYCTSKTDTLHQEYIHKNLFCTILAKEKPIQRDNRYFFIKLKIDKQFIPKLSVDDET